MKPRIKHSSGRFPDPQSIGVPTYCALVKEALDAVNLITKGLTRKDVEKKFAQDGGLFSRSETVYVYKACPLIKVRITFSP